MRVTSSPSLADAASSSDCIAAPSGEPFRAALRAAGTAGQPGAPVGSSPGGELVEQDDHGEDTTAPAAAQMAFLARVTALPGASQTERARLVSSAQLVDRAAPLDAADGAPQVAPPADPTSSGAPAPRTQRATPADAVESAAAALALAPITDSPVAAWTAAAIGRAISTLGAATTRAFPAVPHPRQLGAPPATRPAPVVPRVSTAAASARASARPAASGAAATGPTGVAAASAPGSALPDVATALTPLEQAVHDLVDRLDAIEAPRRRAARSAHDDAAPTAPTAAQAPAEPTAPAAAQAPAEPARPAMSTS